MDAAPADRRLAIVFPGQGSQSVGMLSGLAGDYQVVKETFDAASRVLGYDLWRLVQEGPEEDLNRTERTQPAMLTAGIAVWRVWKECGGSAPMAMAGHSLGEYAALVCADALSLERAVELVQERARYMQDAVPAGQGAMAAILGLDDEQVIDACAQAAQGDIVSAVNFNAPGQVVIAGAAAAVERAVALTRAAGAKRAVMLPVSVPSHCSLMKPAAENMRRILSGAAFTAPTVPVIHNADVASYNDTGLIRDALVRQLYSPVRWVETVRKMQKLGVNAIAEFGPGKVLTGLNKRIDRALDASAVYDTMSLSEALDGCS